MDLLLLAPYDLNNPLPTLFEVFALDELQSALRNGLSVGLFNILDRAVLHLSPQFARLQPFLPEVELILAGLIEGQFLSRFDATTTQRLFGMKLTRAVPRSPVISLASGASSSSSSRQSSSNTSSSTTSSLSTATVPLQQQQQQQQHHHDPRLPKSVTGISYAPLLKSQRILMLLEAALVPYLVKRFDQLHSDWVDDTPEGRERRQRMERSMHPMQLAVVKGFAKLYPILKAVFGITRVAVWLFYMASKIPYPSMSMMLSQVILTRRTVGDEALQKMSKSSNRLFMFLSLVITWTIVGFEVADWWYRDGGRSSVLRERKGLPPPPPTTASSSSSSDQNENQNRSSSENNNTNSTSSVHTVDADDGTCPICHNSVVNPCCNIASGYVCCYPCLAQHVREHGTCPVKSHVRITTRHIRRLFIE